jgi:hypothetical protein
MSERSSQLVEFLRRAMQFQSNQVCDFEGIGEQRIHIVQVSENAFAIGVAFTAENLVTVDGESVEKILLLARGFSTKAGSAVLNTSSFPG